MRADGALIALLASQWLVFTQVTWRKLSSLKYIVPSGRYISIAFVHVLQCKPLEKVILALLYGPRVLTPCAYRDSLRIFPRPFAFPHGRAQRPFVRTGVRACRALHLGIGNSTEAVTAPS